METKLKSLKKTSGAHCGEELNVGGPMAGVDIFRPLILFLALYIISLSKKL
jgi:hypothetical protein